VNNPSFNLFKAKSGFFVSNILGMLSFSFNICVHVNMLTRDHWEDPDLDGRIILRWIFRKWEGGCGDWMELAQDRERWRALVSTVMNFRVPGGAGNFLTSCRSS
jgi:hypothetical protein